MKIHHIGYAVKEISSAVRVFETIGFSVEGPAIVDETRKVIIRFMRNDTTLIELVAPSGDDSPVSAHLKKNGPSPYHICYETPSLENEITLLRENGFIVFENCSEAVAIEGRRVAFLHNASIGIVELVQA
jgi:methylmalonyl-CoA/ethylmalonyl-CoA epimerase